MESVLGKSVKVDTKEKGLIVSMPFPQASQPSLIALVVCCECCAVDDNLLDPAYVIDDPADPTYAGDTDNKPGFSFLSHACPKRLFERNQFTQEARTTPEVNT